MHSASLNTLCLSIHPSARCAGSSDKTTKTSVGQFFAPGNRTRAMRVEGPNLVSATSANETKFSLAALSPPLQI